MSEAHQAKDSANDAPADVAKPREDTGTRVAGRRHQLEGLAVPAVLVLLVLVFSALIPTFRTVSNIEGMVNSQAVVLMLALAAAVTLRTGSFDLSIASVMVASGATVATLSTSGYSIAVSVLAGILLGVFVGIAQGYLIVKIGVDSFITTLGTLTALGGVAYAITQGQIVGGVPASLVEISRATILGIPLATWYSWLLVIIVWYVFERTPLGRHLLFIGGNKNTARLAGVPVDRIQLAAFVLSATLSAGIGVVLVGQLAAIDPSIGPQYLLPPFAAVFLGSTAFTPGRFNAFGTLVAVYLLVVGITGLSLLGVASWVSAVFNGLALVLAVTAARLAARSK